MEPTLRVASLNLRATPNRSTAKLLPLAELIGAHEPDVVLLQECRRGWLEVICKATGMAGVHSHELLSGVADLPADGCAIAVRGPLRIERAWTVPVQLFAPAVIEMLIGADTPAGFDVLPAVLGSRFSARSLLAEVGVAGPRFVAGSSHATPGTGRYGPRPGKLVGEWKPFFHGGVAAALAGVRLPFVFAIDANEPAAETMTSVRFHWADGRLGARKFGALLGLDPVHRGRDLLREQLEVTGRQPASDTYLALSYTTHRGGPAGGRRFDSMWATPEFELAQISTLYAEALQAGTDHALQISELILDNHHPDVDRPLRLDAASDGDELLRAIGFVRDREGLWLDPAREIGAAAHPAGIFIGWIDVTWPHPATPVMVLRGVVHLPTAAHDPELDQVIADSRRRRQHGLRSCSECGNATLPGHMHDETICQGCAQERHGLVY